MTIETQNESRKTIPRKAPRIRRAAGTIFIIASGVLLAGLVITYAGTREYRWRGFDVEVAVQPALEGRTRLVFNPLGDVRAATHSAPVELKIALKGISFEEAKKLVLNPPPREELEAEFESAARRSLQSFALPQLAIGVVAALVVPLIARSRRASHWVGSAAAGAGAVAFCFYQISATYNPRAFENPTYTGSLREAGWIIGMARDGFARAEALSYRLKRAARNVSGLYGRLDSAGPLLPEEDTVRILHISDIHNNLAAIGFVKELAERANVSMVIDTGDLTDLGLPVETQLVRGIAGLPIPYLFVAGNHDSRATVGAVSSFPGVRILDGEVQEVGGFRILGAPDPSSRRAASGSVDSSDEQLQVDSQKLLGTINGLEAAPDIVAVHNPKQAKSLVGKARVILAGHMHSADVEQRDGTVFINAGTTGGAGVRFFDRKDGVPFTAAILGFSESQSRRLAFVDMVSLDVGLGEYSITRKTIRSESE
jgi:predicted phosphodiesterase